MNNCEEIKSTLGYEPKNAGLHMDENEIRKAFDFCEGYKKFLDSAKTEREAVSEVITIAIQKGFVPFEYGIKYMPGDKVYFNNRDKALILAIIGKKSLEDGIKIVASHIDSPRIDLKPNPLYEDAAMAYFKTHYYGGIKKYQWTATPLALHGVVIKANGEKVEICVGEDESDPIFYITDLLPHLASEQLKKTLMNAVTGEGLNVLVGSLPMKDEKGSDKTKCAVLKLLNDKYGITEEDFISAELTLVPAAKARDIGFDRSLLGAYGHDDRVCSYPAYMSLFEQNTLEYTAVTILADKEEIGSSGNTGLNTNYLYDFICELCATSNANPRKTLKNSKCLSADVNACFDPNFSEVYEKRNSALINCGVVLTKYTGSRGKSGTSDASAEFVGQIRKLLNDNKISWQCGELGKVDEGGGGTVAQYIAKLNIDVVDIGVAVLSMHAPYEVVSKLDVYSTYRAFVSFFKD